MELPQIAKPALRRGLATLTDALVLASWTFVAFRYGAHRWDWLAFGIPLGVILWVDARPYRTTTSNVSLGKLARWLLVLRFVVLVSALAVAPAVAPTKWTVVAVITLFFVGALLRVVEVRRPLRLITAAAGGGFLVRYPADSVLDLEIEKLPGAERDGAGWKVAATPQSADALLRFAREHEFEFTPQR